MDRSHLQAGEQYRPLFKPEAGLNRKGIARSDPFFIFDWSVHKAAL